MIDLKTLIKAGVQFGHQTWRWCPKMRPYIWGQKNGVHLIDISKTAYQIDKASKFLESVASEGKPILWVGTKKAAQQAVEQYATSLKCPYVTNRWIGGTLTNFQQVKKLVTKLLHYEDVLSKADQHLYTKKERGEFQKIIERLTKNAGGIRKLTWPVGALIVVDVKKEHVAIREAQAMGIPVVGIVDTNSDPSLVDYPIPANDDVARAISVVLEPLVQAIERGKAVAAARPQEEIVTHDSIEQLIERALGAEDEDEEGKASQRRKSSAVRQTNARRTPTSRPPLGLRASESKKQQQVMAGETEALGPDQT